MQRIWSVALLPKVTLREQRVSALHLWGRS